MEAQIPQNQNLQNPQTSTQNLSSTIITNTASLNQPNSINTLKNKDSLSMNLKKPKQDFPKRIKRYIGYGIITTLALLLPFININGHQLFLLSFVHKELHLLGVVFSVQELYLMPFLLILLFIGIFFMTTLGGRVWCGWCCPQTIFRVIYRDLIETKILGLRKRINDKQKKPDYALFSNKIKKALGVVIFACLSLIVSADFLFLFMPPNEFFSYIADAQHHTIAVGAWLAIAAFLTLDVTLMAEGFCIYACPYARVQSVMYDDDTLMAIYDANRGGAVYAPSGIKNELAPKKQNPANECTNCVACVKVCPTHIDIRKGMQLECINCLECVDACSEVMAHYNRPSLVRWSSPNAVATSSGVRFFRTKTIGYIIVLCVIFAILIAMSGKKEPMLLNVDRNTQAYEIRKSGAVDNYYTFLFQNTDTQAHDFYFEVVDNENIRILEPGEAVRVEPNGKVKKAVALRVQNPLDFALESKDLREKLIIRAYALDDDEIFVERESFFVYPSKKRIEAKARR